MRYVDEVAYLQDLSVHHPRYKLHAKDVIQYLGSRECREMYTPERCTFTICDIQVRRSEETIGPRVVTFINEVLHRRPINYTFDTDELRELLETRDRLLIAHSFMEHFDRPRISSNLGYALLDIMKTLVGHYNKGEETLFWNKTLLFRNLLVQGVKEAYISSTLVTNAKKYVDYIYQIMLDSWEEEYSKKINYIKKTASLSSFGKPVYPDGPVVQSLDYCTLLLERAFVDGKIKEEFQRIKEEREGLDLGDTGRVALQSVYDSIMFPDRRSSEIIFNMLSFAKGYTISRGYPVPVGFEKRVLENIQTLLLSLDNHTLERNIADAFADAYLGYAKDISTIRNFLLATLTYNVKLLKDFGILTEEKMEFYLKRGRDKYGFSNEVQRDNTLEEDDHPI